MPFIKSRLENIIISELLSLVCASVDGDWNYEQWKIHYNYYLLPVYTLSEPHLNRVPN